MNVEEAWSSCGRCRSNLSRRLDHRLGLGQGSRQGECSSGRESHVRQGPHDWCRGPAHRPGRVDRRGTASLGEVLGRALEPEAQERADQDRLGRHPARRRHGVRGQGGTLVRVELEGACRSRPGQQLKAAGKSHVTLFGSDGLFSPDWKIAGSYDSFFPVSPSNATVLAYVKAHNGNGEYFGSPSYVAAQVDTLAITKACTLGHGKTTRAAVRKQIAKMKLKSSILGFPVAFSRGGDLHSPATFGIYQIQKDGTFKPVG